MDLTDPTGQIAYVITRLIGALSSTASQGAWELTVNLWRDSLVQAGVCSNAHAKSLRDWRFLIDSLISISSLADSLSPNPVLGYVGFGALLVGSLLHCFKARELNHQQ